MQSDYIIFAFTQILILFVNFEFDGTDEELLRCSAPSTTSIAAGANILL